MAVFKCCCSQEVTALLHKLHKCRPLDGAMAKVLCSHVVALPVSRPSLPHLLPRSLSLSLFFSLLHSRHVLAGEGGAGWYRVFCTYPRAGPGHRGWLPSLRRRYPSSSGYVLLLALSLSLFFSLIHSRHVLAGEGGAAEGPGHRGWLPSPRRRYPSSSGSVLLLLSQERPTAIAIRRLDGSGKRLTCTVTGVCTPR